MDNVGREADASFRPRRNPPAGVELEVLSLGESAFSC